MDNQALTLKRPHCWDIGIDLSQRSHGAIRFAHWLHQTSAAEERLRGVYVGSQAKVRSRLPGGGSAVQRACAMVQTSTEAVVAGGHFVGFEVSLSDAPEQELGRLAQRDNTDGLIVGRAAPIVGWSLLTLGRVTRRLLRSLPCPVVVVPPDLRVDQLGKGPIIVGVQPDPTSVPAVRFACELGERLNLEVWLVHTVEAAPSGGASALSEMLDLRERTQAAELALEQWVEHHEFTDLPRRTEVGRRGEGLINAADRVDATMLVSGSRHLSLGARIFKSSMGSKLAAHARCPVAVVPSEPRGATTA